MVVFFVDWLSHLNEIIRLIWFNSIVFDIFKYTPVMVITCLQLSIANNRIIFYIYNIKHFLSAQRWKTAGQNWSESITSTWWFCTAFNLRWTKHIVLYYRNDLACVTAHSHIILWLMHASIRHFDALYSLQHSLI